MQKQIILLPIDRPNDTIIINNNGIFIKNVHKKQKKKAYEYNNLQFKICSAKIDNNIKDYIFIVSFKNNLTQGYKCQLKGKDSFQQLLDFIGQFIFIKGIQNVIEDSYKIGQGGFSKVYLIKTVYGDKYAVKTFHKCDKNDKNYKMFISQLQIMKKIKGRHVLSTKQVFQTQKYYYIKLQYIKTTLKTMIKQKLTVKTQKIIMKQILLGLIQLNRHNIVHRDLKPDNIMIRQLDNNQFQCVIIDFGLAIISSQKPYLYNRCGSPGYISPEIANYQIKKQSIQLCISDMFSLGCIFHKILTHQSLFKGKDQNQTFLNNKKLHYPKYYFDKISQNQKDLLQKMLDKNPQTRITAQQALKHPYFIQEIDDQNQIPDEQILLTKKMKKLNKFCIIKSMNDLIQTSITMHENTLHENSSFANALKCSKIKDSHGTFHFQIKNCKNSSKNEDFAIDLSINQYNQQQNESNNKRIHQQSTLKANKTLKLRRYSKFKQQKISLMDNQKTN